MVNLHPSTQHITLCQVIPTKWWTCRGHRFCDVISPFVYRQYCGQKELLRQQYRKAPSVHLVNDCSKLARCIGVRWRYWSRRWPHAYGLSSQLSHVCLRFVVYKTHCFRFMCVSRQSSLSGFSAWQAAAILFFVHWCDEQFFYLLGLFVRTKSCYYVSMKSFCRQLMHNRNNSSKQE